MRLDPVRTPLTPPAAARSDNTTRFGAVLAAESPPRAAGLAAMPHSEAAFLLPATLEGAQEADQRACKDREARRHAASMLTALARLQIGRLSGDPAEASLLLTDLAASLPDTDDPVLRSALQAIAQRAAVELARIG